QWLERFGTRRTQVASADSARFDMPARYRELCQHLALARDRQYSADLIERLSRLALAGHQLLYGARGRGLDRLRNFLRADFPRAVRREWRFVWLAVALFMGPLVALTLAIPRNPDFAYVVLPADVLDSAQEVRRWLQGARPQARRRHRCGDVRFLYLQ